MNLQVRSAFRVLLVGIVLLASVAGGVYVGHALTDRSTSPSPPQPVDGDNHGGPPRMSLSPGDLFPPELARVDEKATDFGSLLHDREAIVVFVSMQCSPCLDLLRFWSAVCRNRIRDDVLQIVVLADSTTIPPEYLGLLTGFSLVRYHASTWKELYNQDFWPTIVGVDNNGFITHLQYGFEQSIDHELAQRFFTPVK